MKAPVLRRHGPSPRPARLPSPTLAPASETSRVASWTALAVSVLAAWFLLYALVLSALQQHRDNANLYAVLRENLSQATTPIGGVIAPQTPIALLNGPLSGLHNAVVVEGTSPSELKLGIGHRRDTPLPGQEGVSVLYGRSVTFGGVFGDIDTLRAGQQLQITTGQGKFVYQVDGVRHKGDPLPSQLPTGGSRLLLETSTGQLFGQSTEVFVDATLVGKSVATPSGRVSGVPDAERAFGTDTTSVLPLVLWLQALLIAVGGAVWAFVRWGRAQAWVAGLPVIVFVLWRTTDTMMSLLPNLI